MKELKKEFSKIYDKYVEKIFRFVFLKVNSKEIAEDLTSETFLRMWEVFKNQKIENVSGFLYQIARHLIIDYYRQKNKGKITSIENKIIIDPKGNLEEKAKLESDLERVKKALVELNEDYQNALIWYYIEDYSIKEIAGFLGRTEEATRVLISRAIKSLRQKITQV